LVIVYERDGNWSRALRRFLSRRVNVIELPPFEDYQASPETARVTLTVVSGPSEAREVLQWARQADKARDGSLIMAVVRPADQELAWCLRETGVRLIWDEYWHVPAMAQVIERFCRRHRRPDLSVEQRIWNNLPWKPQSNRTREGTIP
jgi:hypothetical protein